MSTPLLAFLFIFAIVCGLALGYALATWDSRPPDGPNSGMMGGYRA